ncbi:MAG: ATP-NAD kinase family protein [Kangiellaceae bacterium]|nr:ATP-NAD kinase family protein [Kangiellaceae bacterium]MCW8997452.1 ATP-NAD kinase family protein [Kangiellaceae bacterium]MCW9018208.1 ATP-NAD kinase family protein [Kangiellaceae bacterium]
MFTIGLIINPYAGIGGRVGLKGSDGIEVREKALALGAPKLANKKAKITLSQLLNEKDAIQIKTVSGDMGESLCQELGFGYQVIYSAKEPSTEEDTKQAVKQLLQDKVDLILFAGGDGTARNIFEVCDEQQMVLGIPAGVKIHSGVYAISPEAAGLLIAHLVQGDILSLRSADVMDIDEEAFRDGVVKAKPYGYLNIPAALEYVQATKSGGKEVEELVLDDIAAEVIESMEDDTYYVVGSGTTCAALMEQLGLDNTLLGSDVVFQEELYRSDVIEKDLLELIELGKKVKFIITVIGGQGHILGRGNHQLSPQVIRKAGWDNFEIIATKAKLKSLHGRPLLVDTGDVELDHQLRGTKRIITGYRDYAVYPVGFDD